ncbi:hNH endonuclease [Salmonella enterica]
MQTINNRMTETQIADLFSLAVQLQVKAEESDDRDTAILAYSIQNACSNLTESRREFWAADATINNLELKITDMAVQLANAESKCRELAAENAGMKEALEYVINPDNAPEYHSLGMGCGVEDRGYQRDGYSACEYGWESAMERVYSEVIPDAIPETPATDAFLAEVRAQGVDMFSEKFGGGTPLSNMVKEVAAEFAAQLRKGAAL